MLKFVNGGSKYCSMYTYFESLNKFKIFAGDHERLPVFKQFYKVANFTRTTVYAFCQLVPVCPAIRSSARHECKKTMFVKLFRLCPSCSRFKRAEIFATLRRFGCSSLVAMLEFGRLPKKFCLVVLVVTLSSLVFVLLFTPWPLGRVNLPSILEFAMCEACVALSFRILSWTPRSSGE